jgi:hypothetical protein
VTIASDLLRRHFETLVQDNARWQTLIALREYFDPARAAKALDTPILGLEA